jgi:sialate O-acetylesterase
MHAFCPRSIITIALAAGFTMALIAGCNHANSRGNPPMANGVIPATQPANVKLAAIFSNNMVLQRQMALPIFGTARPGSQVRVQLAGQTHEAVADPKGNWIAHFDSFEAGGPYELSVTSAGANENNRLKLSNILIGEVWVCTGQSNMELLVRQCSDADKEIAAANFPRIRINSSSGSFVKASGRDWVECSPKCVGNCSAVGYFFGRELHNDLNVPIGLVVRAVGGTVIKQWAPRSGEWLENDPELKPLHDEWARTVETFAQAKKSYAAWQATTREAKNAATVAYGPPQPIDPKRWGGMYDGQISPLLPFAIRGVIWYQGETDARTGHEDDQRSTLPLMIRAWRKAWGEGEFPFLMVQLANDWGGSGVNKAPALPATPPDNQHWPWVREAQAAACKLIPNAAMACTIDLGGRIHYPGKQDVGRRLARLAEAQVYKFSVVAQGPAYVSMDSENVAIRLHFTNIGRGLVSRDGKALQGFSIAGSDHKFVWASAQLDGDQVIVSHPSIKHPLAVRYDWSNDPHGNLYSLDGLPTAPFRTDDWPRIAPVRTALTTPEQK